MLLKVVVRLKLEFYLIIQVKCLQSMNMVREVKL